MEYSISSPSPRRQLNNPTIDHLSDQKNIPSYFNHQAVSLQQNSARSNKEQMLLVTP